MPKTAPKSLMLGQCDNAPDPAPTKCSIVVPTAATFGLLASLPESVSFNPKIHPDLTDAGSSQRSAGQELVMEIEEFLRTLVT